MDNGLRGCWGGGRLTREVATLIVQARGWHFRAGWCQWRWGEVLGFWIHSEGPVTGFVSQKHRVDVG